MFSSRRLLGLGTAIFFLSQTLLCPSEGSEQSARSKPAKLRRLSSAAGGYSLLVPASWQIQETVNQTRYDAIITEEAVPPTRDSPCQTCVMVTRLRHYRDVPAMTDLPPVRMASEMATILVKELTNAEEVVTVLAPDDPRHPGYHYAVATGGVGEACRQLTIAGYLHEQEWFHAGWLLPCGATKSLTIRDKVETMVYSIILRTNWGP